MAKPFKPGGRPGALHEKLGVAIGTRIPHARLVEASHSADQETRDMAIRAMTMAGWHKGGKRKKAKA